MPHNFPVPANHDLTNAANGDPMHEVTHVSIWSGDGPTHHLKYGVIEERDDYVVVTVPTARLLNADGCPRHPNGYEIHVSDQAREYGDDPTVYEGEIRVSISGSHEDDDVTRLKCEPNDLNLD